MPAYSTLRTFIAALKTGQTNITRSLEGLINDDEKRQGHAWRVRNAGVFDGAFDPWLREMLGDAGLSTPEIDHVERWPDPQKETVRQEIVAAIDDNRTLGFNWEIWEGADPVSDVREETPGTRRVVFRSPRAGVRLSGVNFGSIHVDA